MIVGIRVDIAAELWRCSMMVQKEGGKAVADPTPCSIVDMLGFDPRELNMLGFELDDDEITEVAGALPNRSLEGYGFETRDHH
jgi:hypothetical protein